MQRWRRLVTGKTIISIAVYDEALSEKVRGTRPAFA